MRNAVVVGGGLAGAAAVEALRDEGFDGRVTMIAAEPHLPYERPPLSKEYLRGEQPAEALTVRPEDWYRDHDVELLLGAEATELHPADRRVVLGDGSSVPYDAVLLATGGAPKVLAEPSERVLYLRTIEDSDRLRPFLAPGRRLVVVGAGFIGSEVAASARTLGADVLLLDLEPAPLARAVGDEVGAVMAAVHRDHGVELRMGQAVGSVEERDGGVVARTASGLAIEGDAAVVGVAITPNTALAERAGLAVEDGVVVDERCRASVDGVFAAGDVAAHRHPLFGRRVRVEHFDNAIKQGAAAARAMLGREEPYDHPHWFWSDQYDLNIQMAGLAHGADRTVVRGSAAARDAVWFWLRDGVVVAALGLNRGRDVRRSMRLIAARARPDPGALADEGVDLRRLAPLAADPTSATG